MATFIDLSNRIFGMLTVIQRSENNKWGTAMWICKCECGKEKIISGSDLLRGNSVSCGCFQISEMKRRLKKYNEYFYIDEHKIGLLASNKKDTIILIDAEDFGLVKSYCWLINKYGYVTSRKEGKMITISRIIMNAHNPKEIVDHIDRNKLNNTKQNLRIVNPHISVHNRGLYSTNTSGVIGVQKTKYNSWLAKLDYNKKKSFL